MRNKTIWIIAITALVIAVSVVGIYLHDPNSSLNKSFPPLKSSDQRWNSSSRAISELAGMDPNIAAGFSGEALQNIISNIISTDARLARAEVEVLDGLVSVSAAFRGPLNPEAEVDATGWPNDKNELAVDAEVFGYVDFSYSDSHIILMPGFKTLKVNALNAKGVSVPTEELSAVLMGLLDRINGGLTISRKSKLLVKLDPFTVNFSEQLSEDPKNTSITENLSATEISIKSAVLMPRGSELLLLAEAEPIELVTRVVEGEVAAESSPSPSAPSLPFEYGKTESEAQEVYTKALASVDNASQKIFTEKPEGKIWLVIQKKLIYQTFNAAAPKSDMCVTRKEDDLNSEIDAEPKLYEIADTDCRMNEDCKRTYSCDRPACSVSKDTRDCMERWEVCAPSWAGGGCVSSDHENPLCITGRNAQNAVYAADRLQCEAKRAHDIAGCEVGKAAEESICKVAKEAVNVACTAYKATLPAINKLAEVGYIDGSATTDYQATACISDVKINPSTAHLSGRIRLAAFAYVSAKMDFYPTLQGLLVCTPLWDTSVTANATINPIDREFGGKLSLRNDKNGSGGKIVKGDLLFDNQTIKVRFDEPLLVKLFKQNPQLVIQCNPVISGLLAAYSSYAMLSDDFDNKLMIEREHEVKDIKMDFTIHPIHIDGDGVNIDLVPAVDDTAIVFIGDEFEVKMPVMPPAVTGCDGRDPIGNSVNASECNSSPYDDSAYDVVGTVEVEEIAEEIVALGNTADDPESFFVSAVSNLTNNISGHKPSHVGNAGQIVLPPNYSIMIAAAFSADGPDIILSSQEDGKCFKAIASVRKESGLIEERDKVICGESVMSMRETFPLSGSQEATIRLIASEPVVANYKFSN